MEKEIKFKIPGTYKGHSVKQNGVVELNLGFKYSELHLSVLNTQLLNENISLFAKLDGSVESLGVFMIKNIGIDHDGNSTIKYGSTMDNAESNTINELSYKKTDDVMFMLKATIEVEEGEDEDE